MHTPRVLIVAACAALAAVAGVAWAANLPDPTVSIQIDGTTRTITSNGIPNHAPGRFPNRGNPNTIRAQSHRYRMTTEPADTGRLTPLRGVFGVALNGVPMEPGTAEIWTPQGRSQRGRGRDYGWHYEAIGTLNLGLDQHHAHVQPTGMYHYHGVPTGFLSRADQTAPVLLGYAADGFPIYGPRGYSDPDDPESEIKPLVPGYRLKSGNRPGGADAPSGRYDGTYTQDYEFVEGLGDLDEANGRVGVTPEYPDGTYHYVITDSFPFISRYYRGTPDNSFAHRHAPGSRPGSRPGSPPGSGSGGRGGGGPGGGPPEEGGRRPPPHGHHPPPPRR